MAHVGKGKAHAGKLHRKVRQEPNEMINSLMACNFKEGESVCSHVQKMQRYVEQHLRFDLLSDEDLAVDMVLNSLGPSYD